MKSLHRYLLIFLVLISYKTNTYCQNFAPINASWLYQDYRVDCLNSFFIKIESDRDTTIDNKLVTILEVYENNVHIPEGRTYIHENDNKVFFYEDGTFKLIYDFSLEAGDTAIVNIPQNRTYYDFSCNNGALDLINNKSKVIVDSISFAEIQGQQLKVLHTKVDFNDFENDCFLFRKITERIGSEKGLFGWNCMQCLAGCTGLVKCYSDEVIDYSIEPAGCNGGIDSTKGKLADYRLNIFPNPTKDDLFLDSEIEIKAYQVLDFNGRTLIQEDNFTGDKIQTNSLKNGVYLLGLFDKNGHSIFSQKIVKK